MYRIMLVKDKRDNYGSLYSYLTEVNGENQTVPVEFATKEELDTYVETMLNGNYAKSDFIVVSVADYNVKADIVE